MHAFTIFRSAFPPVSLQYRPPAIAPGGQDVVILLGHKDGDASCPHKSALLQGQVEDLLVGLLYTLRVLRGEDDQVRVEKGGDAAFLQKGVHLIVCHPFRQVGDHPQAVATLTQRLQSIQCIAIKMVLLVCLPEQGKGQVEEDRRAQGIVSYGINQRAILCRGIYECFRGRMEAGRGSLLRSRLTISTVSGRSHRSIVLKNLKKNAHRMVRHERKK